MKGKLGKVLLCSFFLAALLGIAPFATADTITYDYTGAQWTSTVSGFGTELTGTITLTGITDVTTGWVAAADISSWSYTAGGLTMSQAQGDSLSQFDNALSGLVYLNDGQITQWDIETSVTSSGLWIDSLDQQYYGYPNDQIHTSTGSYAYSNNAGAWTLQESPVPTPEPSSLILLMGSILGLIVLEGFRKKSRAV